MMNKQNIFRWCCFSAIVSGIALLFVVFEAPLLRGAARVLPYVDAALFLEASPSPILVDREDRMLFAFLNEEEQWNFPVSLERVSPRLVEATLAAEDRRFYAHAGVDGRAVLRACWHNLREGRIVSGASTLTMQLVKRCQPRERRMSGKFFQALDALRLERSTGKEELLVAYLNTAPYGGNIVGVEAAARRYFGKSAAEVTLPEAALLAGLPKSPTQLNPLLRPAAALARRNSVLRRMRDAGWIDESAYEGALHTPLGVSWHDYPALAPHLAQALQGDARTHRRLALTLDYALQSRLEDLLKRHLLQYDNQINNGALIVVETATGNVLARVGSADFGSDAIQGQFDVCRAPRAPGSALKPFIYALAMEHQRLYPTEAFLDRNLDYGVYNPNNFDGEFSGLVSAGEALRWSLNVPAVRILDRVGVEPALDFLRALGFDTIQRASDHYGLGLTLGNCEVRLESLVNAYLTLARLGERQDMAYRRDLPPTAPARVLSEGVALALWYMLEQPFPEEPWTHLVRLNDRNERLCWKTGTSTGYRDAWAVAFNGHYVVGVWLGNTDARSSSRLIGAHAALPLAARVFRSLPPQPVPAWPPPDKRLVEVEVCATTGMPKSPWCPVGVSASFPSEQYLHRRCAVHRPGPGDKIVMHWPANPRIWDLGDIPQIQVPGGTDDLETAAVQRSQRKLNIMAPVENATYVLSGESGEDRIRLEANLDHEALQWYVNGLYLGASERARPLFLNLTPGEHRVSCMNAAGQTDQVVFTVLTG